MKDFPSSPDALAKQFSRRLKTFAVFCDFNQSELAHYFCVPTRSLAPWMTGKKLPRTYIYARIDYLLKEKNH